MWSCCEKTLCLWSTDTGAWLGKIESTSGNRDMEEDMWPSAAAISMYSGGGSAYAFEDVTPPGSISPSDSNLRINSNRVCPCCIGISCPALSAHRALLCQQIVPCSIGMHHETPVLVGTSSGRAVHMKSVRIYRTL